MNKSGNEFIPRIRDKSNKFILVDKKTDKENAKCAD